MQNNMIMSAFFRFWYECRNVISDTASRFQELPTDYSSPILERLDIQPRLDGFLASLKDCVSRNPEGYHNDTSPCLQAKECQYSSAALFKLVEVSFNQSGGFPDGRVSSFLSSMKRHSTKTKSSTSRLQ